MPLSEGWQMEKTPYQIGEIFPILALSVFSAMLGMGLIAPILPLYVERMGATGTWVGVIFASFAISRTVLMPVIRGLSDRFGRKKILCFGLLMFAPISIGYVWATRVSELTFIRLSMEPLLV